MSPSQCINAFFVFVLILPPWILEFKCAFGEKIGDSTNSFNDCGIRTSPKNSWGIVSGHGEIGQDASNANLDGKHIELTCTICHSIYFLSKSQ